VCARLFTPRGYTRAATRTRWYGRSIDPRVDRGAAADAGGEIPAWEGAMRVRVREKAAVIHARTLTEPWGRRPARHSP
jgi:hypothetical protein